MKVIDDILAVIAKIVEEEGIVFTSNYFQVMTGQPMKNIPKKEVTREEMILICKGKSDKYCEYRNTLFITRGEKGNLRKTCYVDEKGNKKESTLFYS